ncbi:FAD:protein FMN transferase [Candidatus Azambacteria bacterium]|nr:FAD:protein FMN transferase [Candidatus Azambacteria bacterium]
MASAMTSNAFTPLRGDSVIIERTFGAMGTHVTIALCAIDKSAAENDIYAAQESIKLFECRFSRFLPESELSHLNKSAGNPYHASGEMIDLLTVAWQWHRETKGVFDPSVIGALENLGYDRSLDFDKGPARTDANIVFNMGVHQAVFSRRGRFADMRIHKKSGDVVLPQGLRIDFGGVGKGYIVDKIAMRLAQKYDHFWISAGGDMYVKGCDLAGKPWEVGVQDPLHLQSDIGNVTMKELSFMAVATSGVMKRRGEKGGLKWHHIIDPRTGFPATQEVIAVTVLARTTVEADVCAKTALILGKEAGMAFIEKRAGCAAIMIDQEGRIAFSSRMKGFFIPVI